jgi:hypothetical protein
MNDRKQFELLVAKDWDAHDLPNFDLNPLGDYVDDEMFSAFAWFKEGLAARATPAQPVPSPSSVGAAISSEERQTHYNALTKIIFKRYPRIKGVYCASIAYGIIDYIHSISEAAALAEQVQGQQWISVDDKMPESGKRVVFAWTNQLGKERTSMGQWNERWKQVANSSDEDACEYDEELDEYYLLEGWQEWGWEVEFSAYVEGKVTHWMPLPAAPSIAQDGQKSEADHG